MVSFYRKNKRRGKCIAEMGYGKFNFIRDIYMACWDPEFALHFFGRDDNLKWSDAKVPFPKSLRYFLALPDCDGELSNKEIKAVCKALSKNKVFVEGKQFPSLVWGRWNNRWMNDPEWRKDAQKFFDMLQDCSKRGCGIEWF